jgi:hypothetical protein
MAVDRRDGHQPTQEEVNFKAGSKDVHEQPVASEHNLNRLQQLAIEYGIPVAIVTAGVLAVAHNLHIGG